VFCQDLCDKYFFVYGEHAETQATADPVSVATIVLIAVFVAALAFGLLFLLGTRKQASGAAAATVPSERRSSVDTMGDDVGRIFIRLDIAINLLFSGLIFLYKWAFNYNSRPAGLASTTVISDDTRTRTEAPPSPEPVSPPAAAISPVNQSRPALPAPAITGTQSILIPPITPWVQLPAAPPAPVTNPRPADQPYGLQSIIDIMGEGIEIALVRMSDGIVFIFDGLINLFKWIFRIDRQ
jgi:hypothetical protein